MNHNLPLNIVISGQKYRCIHRAYLLVSKVESLDLMFLFTMDYILLLLLLIISLLVILPSTKFLCLFTTLIWFIGIWINPYLDKLKRQFCIYILLRLTEVMFFLNLSTLW